jgi:hypothetical protein
MHVFSKILFLVGPKGLFTGIGLRAAVFKKRPNAEAKGRGQMPRLKAEAKCRG